MRTVALTAAALLCFAANSLLCRLALGSGSIDPITFTTIRVVSGAVALALLVALSSPTRSPARGGSWGSALWLVVYAVPFAIAYRSLTAGTGALILFGGVQLTMIGSAVARGSRPTSMETGGALLAMAGLAALVWPGLAAPSLSGAALMAMAGAAWGVYSLRGRVATDPLADTAGNFLRALPFVGALSLVALGRAELTLRGILIAVASGALASGGGYIVWYAALKQMSAVRAAVVQLAVPVVAAAGGVALLGETVTGRLVGTAAMVLGGIGLAVAGRSRQPLQ